jgi:hypothetical protein
VFDAPVRQNIGGSINRFFDRLFPNQIGNLAKQTVTQQAKGMMTKAAQQAGMRVLQGAATEAAAAAGVGALLPFIVIAVVVIIIIALLLIVLMPKVNDCCQPHAIIAQNQNQTIVSNPATNSLSPTTTSSGSNLDSTAVLKLLPTTLPTIGSKASAYQDSVNKCLDNLAVYQQASEKTQIPWQILAGIHHIEGSCNPAKNLQNGATLTGTLLDSAIQAGNSLKGKIGKIPTNFQELAKALALYNGPGNSNCNKGEFVPYPAKYCPPSYPYEDHIYPLSFFDNERHEQMYVVYCADRVKCDHIVAYTKPGVLTVIRLLVGK